MPIGKFKDFDALKEALAKRHRKAGPVKDMGAYTASVADKMEPGWRKEAAPKAGRTRHLEALQQAASRRAAFRRRR